MSKPKLIGERNILFLDEMQAKGAERETPPAYPNLTEGERTVLKVVANGLYLSESSIQWAYFNAQRGEKDAFRRVLEILSSGKLKLRSNAG